MSSLCELERELRRKDSIELWLAQTDEAMTSSGWTVVLSE